MQDNLMERFSASLKGKDGGVLDDVRHYLEWQSGLRDPSADGAGEVDPEAGSFVPTHGDDVELRTYLLHLRLRGLSRRDLRRRVRSLQRFYAWLRQEGYIPEDPFAEFDFDRPFLSREQIRRRQDAFQGDPQEQEIARLQALNRLISRVNQAPDVQSALDAALQTLVEVLGLRTAWAFLHTEAGLLHSSSGAPPLHDYELAAEVGLPPGLERRKRYFLRRPPDCHCQALLRQGLLKRAVNIVECTRLQSSLEARGDNRGLLYHASVPITIAGRPVGVMNFATEEWQFLSAADLQLLSAAGEHISTALERAHLYDQNRMHRQRLEDELEMARTVQASLLPASLPNIAGFGLAAAWRSARLVSGDFYDVFPLPGGRWVLLVADVADKGAPAALYMTLTQSLVRALAPLHATAGRLLGEVNDMLCSRTQGGTFVTLFCAVLDPVADVMEYALAGHPPPLLRRADGVVEPLNTGGMALGVLPGQEYETYEMQLRTGEALIAYSDGVTEAAGPDGDLFGRRRLEQALEQAPLPAGAQQPAGEPVGNPGPAQALLDHLLRELTAFTDAAPQSDDVTVLVVWRG